MRQAAVSPSLCEGGMIIVGGTPFLVVGVAAGCGGIALSAVGNRSSVREAGTSSHC